MRHRVDGAPCARTRSGANAAPSAPPQPRPLDGSSPKLDRARRKHETAQHLARALMRHETVKTVAAAQAGIRRQHLDDLCDPESAKTLSVADLRALPPAVRLELVRWVADELGCFVAELPDASADVGDDLALALRAQRETSEAVSAHLGALVDGHLDRREASEVLREVEEGIGALLTVRALMRRVAEEGARLVRTVRPYAIGVEVRR